MGRKLSYCKDAALAKASHLFCSRGYEKTCMRDVADAVGVPVASLYHTFGSKEDLLCRVVNAYVDQGVRPRLDLLDDMPNPWDAIRAFLFGMVQPTTSDCEREGCIMLHAAAELNDIAPKAAQAAKRGLNQIQRAMHAAIQRGQVEGMIMANATPAFLANHIMANIIALKSWQRMGLPLDQMEGYIEQVMVQLRG